MSRNFATFVLQSSAALIAFAVFFNPLLAADAGGEGLAVQYKCAGTNPAENQIRAHFRITNHLEQAVPLQELTVRYWYKTGDEKPQKFWCDWAKIGSPNVTVTFHRLKKAIAAADTYLEIGFLEAAGAVEPGGNSGEVQVRVAKEDWSNYDQSNDYSFDAGKTDYTEWAHVTLYRHGQLVWGSEPNGVVARPAAAPSSQPSRVSPAANGPQPTDGHLDNPFVGAKFYRDVDYVAAVNAAADLQGGVLGRQMRQVANYPTFVWLDSIAAVNGTNGYPRSLAGHLDQALAQGANAIGIVIYNLPNRDGAALASNGELLIAQNGLHRYKTEYIDAIFSTIRQSKYGNLRIVMVIEPDSLPNLVVNLSFPKVAEAKSSGAYVQGVQYAIGTLRSISNTYAYIDVAHAGWLGWPSNFKPFVDLLKEVGSGIPGGNSKVDGFISNTANYNVFVEPYMTANQTISGQPVRSLQGWYDWNDYIDEQSYATALRQALTSGSNAYSTRVGLLLDTLRNGWGGPDRPTGPSTSTDLRTFVRATTLDKRIHKGNWGNQSGAGIGARPVANPAPNYDAFVWVKPPGMSDGSSSLIPTGPDNPDGKGFDRMCDPAYHGNSLNGNNLTGALPNAPVSGRWFQAQFVQLVQNAYPVFQPEENQTDRRK